MSLKLHLKGNIVTIFESMILAVFSLILNFYVANNIGKENYGHFTLITSFVFSFMAIGIFIKPFIFLHFLSKYDFKELLFTSFSLNIIVSFFTYIFLNLGIYCFYPDLVQYSLILSLYYFLMSFQFLYSYLVRNSKGNLSSSIKVFSILAGMLVRFFIVKFNFPFHYLFYSYLLEAFIMLVSFSSYLKIWKYKFFINKKAIKEIFTQSFHSSLSGLVGRGYNIYSYGLISSILGFKIFASYMISMRILNVFEGFLANLNIVLFSFFTKDYKSIDRKLFLVMIFYFFLIIFILSSFKFSSVYIFPKVINLSIYPEIFTYSMFIMFSLLFFPFSNYLNSQIIIKEKTHISSKVSFIQTPVSILVLNFFILKFGIYGAFYSLYFNSFLNLLLTYIFYLKYVKN
jgi:O-antigen/teichoic acid export membrane protein